jgi:uroporphyrinogen-III synthase
MRRVLVLRPEPGASATAERARKRGLNVTSMPLFEIEPVDWQAPEASGFDGLLLTSANAVRQAGDELQTLRGLPVYAVGAATAEAARAAGFDVASTGEAGVARLLASVEPDLKLLHLAGEERKVPAEARQEITSVAVYRSTPTEGHDLTAAANSAALIHSPRAAQRFAELIDRSGVDRASVAIAAISAEAAEAAGSGWAAVEVAEAPDDEALLVATERLCNNAAAT